MSLQLRRRLDAVDRMCRPFSGFEQQFSQSVAPIASADLVLSRQSHTMNNSGVFSSINIDDIVINELIPFVFDPVRCAIELMCAFVGIPLNLFVGGVLAFNSSLYRVRNAIWLGVIFSNLLTLFTGLLEFLEMAYPSQVNCKVLTVILGKPYMMVLVNTLLATCDRYIYTRWSSWHEKHVTLFRIVLIELLFSATVPVLLSTPYWAQLAPIRCGLDMRVSKHIIFFMLLITILCIVSKIVVYCQLKKQKTSAIDGIVTREIPLNHRTDAAFDQQREISPESPGEPSSSREDKPGPGIKGPEVAVIVAHTDGRNIRQREMEATTCFVAGLVPLCIFTVPNILWAVWMMFCRVSHSDCNSFTLINVRVTLYVRDLVLLHVCTNILVLVIFSQEFKSAATDNINSIHRLLRRQF